MLVERTKVIVQRAYDAPLLDALVSLTLRLGVAFAFLYPAVAGFFYPDNWIWFVPTFIEAFMPRELFLQLFGFMEILIAVGLLVLRNPTLPATVAMLVLAAVVISDWSIFDITFRDVSILAMAAGLILLHRKGAVVQ